MLKVGITGGIGSGKSTIADIFRLYGIKVYNSDERARALMNESEDVRLKVKSLFGDKAYKENELDRAFLGKIVFENEDLLKKLNAIVHPAVGIDYKSWCKKHHDAPYILKEAAVIFEAGIQEDLDYVILVTAPEEMRINRVMQRDNSDEQSVRARIANQWTDKKKILLSDYVILNDGRHSLLRQVEEVHKFLLKRDAKQSK